MYNVGQGLPVPSETFIATSPSSQHVFLHFFGIWFPINSFDEFDLSGTFHDCVSM